MTTGEIEPRPWKRAILWIAFLGPFFFASYGFANWLASRRAYVPIVAFAWERAIPFVPWTIVPYWSIDLLYGLSLLLCTTRRELDRHALRLFVVQVISVAFFIALPLQFSFGRPAAGGIFGALFTALGSFDKPFNQAPSLHIALLVVIWTRLAAHCPARWRWPLHGWMILIGVSVLTTYQHHFIDIPTGLLVGLATLWAVPDEGASPLGHIVIARDTRRGRLALFYGVGAGAFAAFACLGGAWLWLFWPSIALVLVALSYAAIGERAFQKMSNGRLSAGATGLLAPYLAGAWISSRIWTRRHARYAEVIDGVSIGRIPSAGDLAASKLAAVVDLSAELPCGRHWGPYYRSIPVLDLTVPTREILRAAAEAIEDGREHGPVLVCCALGFSRSAAAVAAWLLLTGRAATVDAAMDLVRRARPAIVLRSDHRAALEALL
ncbi:MAG TPA: phosphatase PAP2/dual specificity phosphatase family protein [Thermoanaerobaculia bacterium]|nr:phosphatase PAP2/dual specificity phosphatase family protein [Thermoanaerobaculia bacterium]